MSRRLTAQPGDRAFAYLTLMPSVALITLLVAVPSITVIAMSFQNVELGSLRGDFVGFDNYVEAFSGDDFLVALRNTFVWVFGSVALEMLLGLGLALLLNTQFRFRGLARVVILAPYLIPTIVAVLVWRYMFDDILGVANYVLMQIGLIGSPIKWFTSTNMAMFSIIIIGAWKFAPFVIITLLGILQSIPQDQYEAAEIDGASKFQQFWRITLPHIMPVFILTMLLRTIWAFHKFDLIYLLTGGGPVDATTTLPILIYLRGFSDFNIGTASAIAVIMFVIILVFIGLYFGWMRYAERNQ